MNSWAITLDKWFLFVAGQIKDRAALRWLYQHRQQITELWFWWALIFSVFYILLFFGVMDRPQDYQVMRELMQAVTLHIGRGLVGDFSLVLMCFGLGAITPVLIALIPFTVFLVPLFMVGAALWVVLAFLSLILAALAPFGLMVGARALFEHYAYRWLAEGGQREKERRAVYASLGLEDGTQRGIDSKARLMDSSEFDAFDARPQRGASIRVGAVNGRPFDYATEKHLLLIASTRGGKGRDVIIPNLNLYPGSVFVLDPKGENAARTHQQRAEFGGVQVLDPFGVSGLSGARFNPLAYLVGDMLVTDAQTLADALIEGEDDHWSNGARQLLTGLILHVVTAPDDEKGKELTTAKDIEVNPDGKAPAKRARDLPTVRRLLMRELPKTLEAMTKNKQAPEVVGDVGEWGLTAAPEEWQSIVSNAIEQTKWLASPQIMEVLSDGGEQIDFAKFRDSVQSVFVCLPAPYFRTFSKWLRLVVAASLDTLTKQLNPAMPYPTRFVLDEVAQLGNLEKIESALTLSAGYGVQLWGIWQHLKDIERCYPRSGVGGWVSSSGIRLIFATQDNDTVRYFAGMTGEAMTETDIRHLGPSQMLCLIDGQNPIIVDRVPGASVS